MLEQKKLDRLCSKYMPRKENIRENNYTVGATTAQQSAIFLSHYSIHHRARLPVLEFIRNISTSLVYFQAMRASLFELKPSSDQRTTPKPTPTTTAVREQLCKTRTSVSEAPGRGLRSVQFLINHHHHHWWVIVIMYVPPTRGGHALQGSSDLLYSVIASSDCTATSSDKLLM